MTTPLTPDAKSPNPERSARTGMLSTKVIDNGLGFTFGSNTATIAGEPMLKLGWFGEHETFCDEPAIIGGGDEAPPPLAYVGMGVGWCVLTQLSRAAELQKVDIQEATAHVEMDWWSRGSMADNTATTGCEGVRLRINVVSDADAEVLKALVVQAEQGCYAENLIRNPVSVESVVTIEQPERTGQAG